MDLENKVSLVTGAGQGIGAGIAKTLAEKGSKVILVDLIKIHQKKLLKKLIINSQTLLIALRQTLQN